MSFVVSLSVLVSCLAPYCQPYFLFRFEANPASYLYATILWPLGAVWTDLAHTPADRVHLVVTPEILKRDAQAARHIQSRLDEERAVKEVGCIPFLTDYSCLYLP